MPIAITSANSGDFELFWGTLMKSQNIQFLLSMTTQT